MIHISVGKRYAICGEAKYSQVEATTELYPSDVKAKMELTRTALTKSPSKLSCAFLIFFAMRKVSEATTSNIFFSRDKKVIAVVLGKTQLKTLFGPTLFNRPQFIKTQLTSESKGEGSGIKN